MTFVVASAVMAISAAACEGGGGGAELTALGTKLSGEGKEGEELIVLEGSEVKDKATLTGKNASTATGKVTYKIYSDKECKTLVASAGEATVSGESVPASSEEELEGGKKYYWQAHYGGDTKNAESTSPCTEVLTVKAKTSLSTELAGEGKESEELTVLEGFDVDDKATLSGTNSSTAGGKALYKVYSDSKCEHLATEAGEVVVSSGVIPVSSEEELEGEATYYWQTTYLGDSLHQESKSTCGKAVLNVKGIACTFPFCEPTMTPGVNLKLVGAGSCTAGPIMTKGAEVFVLTAGHCLGYGNEETETVAKEVQSAYPKEAPTEKKVSGNITFNNSDEYDTAEVKIEQAEWLEKGALPAKLVEWGTPPKVTSVVGKATNKVGEETCYSGASSGAVRCGVILRTGALRSKTENLIETTTAEGVDGDSGAPEFAHAAKGVLIQGTFVGGGKESLSGTGDLTLGSNKITGFPTPVKETTTCDVIAEMAKMWAVPIEGKGIPAKTTITKCKAEAGEVSTIEISANASETAAKVAITLGYKEVGWFEPISQIEAVYAGQTLLTK